MAFSGQQLVEKGSDSRPNGKDGTNKKKKDRSAAGPRTKPSGLYFDVADNPPIHLAALFGFQIAMANVFSCVNMAVLMSTFICSDQNFAASLYSTTAVMSGLCTIIQTTWGVRLPIFQGPSILFTLPYINAASDPAWGCRLKTGNDINGTMMTNNMSLPLDQPWLPQWNKVQGSLMIASGFQLLIGMLGLGGVLLRLMGPISITCLILLLGIGIQSLITAVAEIHWGVSCLNIAIIIILSQYIDKFKIPFPTWSKKTGFRLVPFPLFELFPVILSVLIGWLISYILTVCGAFTEDRDELSYQARTDFGLDAIYEAPILRVPYPGQYGAPSFSVSYTVTMAAAVLASILESVGDYVQTTGPSKVPKPPAHAINRGIITEGIGSLLSGLMGAGHATTSYSNMIGMIGITKVASRRVMNIAGVIMIVLGICGKLGAVFVAIPKPVLAGPIFIAIALLVGAALSNLREVDLWATRSQAVLGIAVMAGTVFPNWLAKHPDTFDTGSKDLDQTLSAILGIPLVVGVIIAMLLDCTMPGDSRLKCQMDIVIESAGNAEHAKDEKSTVKEGEDKDAVEDLSIYDLPWIGRYISTWRVTRYIPFLPDPPIIAPDQQKLANGQITDDESADHVV